MIKHYQDKKYPLSSTNYVDEQLIEEMWDDILRFVCTIKLNYSTASQLFKKLYGHQRRHKLTDINQPTILTERQYAYLQISL